MSTKHVAAELNTIGKETSTGRKFRMTDNCLLQQYNKIMPYNNDEIKVERILNNTQ